MRQELSQTEILQVVSSYAESLSNDGKVRRNQAEVVPAVIGERLKNSGSTTHTISAGSLALSGTVWSSWGVVLTTFLYVAEAAVGAYVIPWAILCYGVYQVLRGIPIRQEHDASN